MAYASGTVSRGSGTTWIAISHRTTLGVESSSTMERRTPIATTMSEATPVEASADQPTPTQAATSSNLIGHWSLTNGAFGHYGFAGRRPSPAMQRKGDQS